MAEEPPFTAADFHRLVHKQIVNATSAMLVEGKLDWELAQPFLDAARALCRADFETRGEIRLHALTGKEEEAFLGVSCSGEDGSEWLSRTWWLSDLALAEEPERARAIVAAVKRSLERIEAALAAES